MARSRRLVSAGAEARVKADRELGGDALEPLTERRTQADVADAEGWLERVILFFLGSKAATVALGLVAVRVIRGQVLVPIQQLGKAADLLATGRYSTRTGQVSGVHELVTLGHTVNAMAQANEDAIDRRTEVQQECEAGAEEGGGGTRGRWMAGEEISSGWAGSSGSLSSNTGDSAREVASRSSAVMEPSGRSAMIWMVQPSEAETLIRSSR